MLFLELSKVPVGAVVSINGNSYIVQKNLINVLVLERGGITFKSTDLGLDKHPDVIIEVVAVKEEPKKNLTDDLKAQVGKQNLAADLRKQLEKGQQVEVVKLSGILTASEPLRPIETMDGKARFENSLTRLAVDKQAARIDHAYGIIENISYDLDHVADGLEDAHNEVRDVKERVDRAEENLGYLEDDVNNFAFDTHLRFQEIDERVAKIEKKEVEENMQKEIQARFNEITSNKQKSTGGFNMKNALGQFKGLFGKVEGQFALAATGGLAMRKGISNEFVTYNPQNGAITDVSSFVLDFKVPAFRLPVEAKDIKVGDIVLNNNNYAYVTDVVENGEYVKTIQPTNATKSNVIPVTNFMFGKPFYTVVTTIDAAGQGGFNPALLLAMGDGKKDDILPFLLMSGGLGGNGTAGGIDPTMLMLLGDNMDDLLPFLLLQQGGVAQEGFNPLMMLALSGDKGGKKDSLLPFLLMNQGGQDAAGGINPMMLMAMSDGDIDPMMLMAMSGGFGGAQGNIFGANPAARTVAPVQTPVQGEEN